MSKWNDILLDVNKMKRYAKDAAKKVTYDVANFCSKDNLTFIDAVIARFMLDQLLLDEQGVIDKWGQLLKKQNEDLQEFYYVLPNDEKFDWDVYFKKIRDRRAKRVL